MDQECGPTLAYDETAPGAVIHDLADIRSRQGSREALASAEAGTSCDSQPDRAARVRALKVAIADGSYTPDPDAIARTLLDRGL